MSGFFGCGLPWRPVVLLAAALFLVSCLQLLESGPQIPGRRGLSRALDRFELAARWRNWPYLLEAFYLPEHAAEVRSAYEGDAGRWFRAVFGGALSAEDEPPPRLCVLAVREKRISPRFDPHFAVYYRIQRHPCQDPLARIPKGAVEGQMDWGYEVKERRWVHLRPVD